MAQADEQPLGKRLFQAGWRQGTIFTARVAYLSNGAGGGDQARVDQRRIRANERLVLITQDCDLVAAPSDEPFVEALICHQEAKTDRLARLDRNSARYFVIDPKGGLVAVARYRVQLDKALLLDTQPQPWPNDEQRLGRFVRWLGRRYNRPALPDALVELLQRPVEAALEQIDQEQPDVGTAFSEAVSEIRINMPEREEPPFTLQMLFLVPGRSLSERQLEAIAIGAERIRASVDSLQVRLDPEPRILSDEELSVAEYFATRPLFLEYLTYRGDEVAGEPPTPGA